MQRNFDGIQFEEIRKKIDGKYNQMHDELSDCYYNKKPYQDYGILDKETFDKLHGAIFLNRDIEFHKENIASKTPIPEEQYNVIYDKDGVEIGKKSEVATQQLSVLNKALETKIIK